MSIAAQLPTAAGKGTPFGVVLDITFRKWHGSSTSDCEIPANAVLMHLPRNARLTADPMLTLFARVGGNVRRGAESRSAGSARSSLRLA